MTKPARIGIVYNVAKQATWLERLVAAAEARGTRVSPYRTRSFTEGTQAARRALDEGCDALVAAGGDGTLLSILGTALEADVPVGALPLGTANDFAREMQAADPARAVQSIVEGEERRADVVWCRFVRADGTEDRVPMCAVAGIGVIAEAIRLGTTPFGRRIIGTFGEAAWGALAVWASASFKARPVVLDFDGQRVTHTMQSLDLLNVGGMGGWEAVPGAGSSTGRLNALMTGRGGVAAVSRLVWTLAQGRSTRELSYVDCLTEASDDNRWGARDVRRVEVHADQPMPVHVMGEAVGFTPAVFEVEPARMRVLAPPATASYTLNPPAKARATAGG